MLLSVYFFSTIASSDAQAKQSGEYGRQPIHLTLEQAIDRAILHNRNLQGSRLSTEGRRMVLETEKTEFDYKLFPVTNSGINQTEGFLGAGIRVVKKTESGIEGSITPRIGTVDSDYTGTISGNLAIPLLKGWGKEINLDNIRMSQFDFQNTSFQQRQITENTVFDVIDTIYRIINREYLVQIYQNSIERFQEQVTVARAKEKVGLAGPIDILRAEIGVKNAQDNFIRAAEELNKLKIQLKILLAFPLYTKLTVTAPRVEKKPFHEMEKVVNEAMDKRIDILQLKLQLAENQRKIEIARHNLKPQLDLRFHYGNNLIDFIDGTSAENEENWYVMIVSTTELQQKKEKTTLQLSLLDLQRTKLALQERIDAVKENITNQNRELEKLRQRLDIREKQARQAKSKLAVAKVKFIHGMSDNFDIIQSETELEDAQINMLNIQTDYMVGTYRLRKEIGTLLN